MKNNKAYWIEYAQKGMRTIYKCSICGAKCHFPKFDYKGIKPKGRFQYCPNCGAKMERRTDERINE